MKHQLLLFFNGFILDIQFFFSIFALYGKMVWKCTQETNRK